jgi:CBS domain-containing protein
MPSDNHPGREHLLDTVGQAMTTPVLVLDADTPADVAARQLAGAGAGAVVRHRGRVVGVVTLDDLLARPLPGLPVPQLRGPFPRHLRLLASLRVWQLMYPGPLVVAVDQPLTEAARLMDEQHVPVLAVVDPHGQPVGVITTGDLIRLLPRQPVDTETITAEAGVAMPEKGVVMADQITLTDQEARALSSLLERASDRLATYEEQTHQDRRLAEEIREAAGDLVNRISRGRASA